MQKASDMLVLPFRYLVGTALLVPSGVTTILEPGTCSVAGPEPFETLATASLASVNSLFVKKGSDKSSGD